jgi:hypothetical protein
VKISGERVCVPPVDEPNAEKETTIVTRFLVIALAAIVPLVAAAGAQGDRPAHKDEKRALARVVDTPKKCLKIRISTRTDRPKWAAVRWRLRKPSCERWAADGVAVMKRRGGNRWKFVTAGSDFECRPLWRKVPRRVARDLGIDCRR